MNFPNKPDLYLLAPMGAAPCKADSGKMDSKNPQTIRFKYFDNSDNYQDNILILLI